MSEPHVHYWIDTRLLVDAPDSKRSTCACGATRSEDGTIRLPDANQVPESDYQRGFRAGAEAMRLAAIEACDNIPFSEETVRGAMKASITIEALPLPESPK